MKNKCITCKKSFFFSEKTGKRKEIVRKLGAQITEDYKDKNLLLVSVLKGSVIFMADLMRAITVPAEIDFMAVSSYGSGTSTSGKVKIIKDFKIPQNKSISFLRGILPKNIEVYINKKLAGKPVINYKKCVKYATSILANI